MTRRIITIVLLILLAGCLPSSSPAPNSPWQAADLRLLDPSDVPDPASDLIAVYTRAAGDGLTVRLDFLSTPDLTGLDISIALDSSADQGFVRLPAGMPPTVSNLPGVQAALQPLAGCDCVVLTLTGLPRALQPPPMIQAVVHALNGSLLDQTAEITRQTPRPTPAPLLLAFSDVLTADTPAQALRRWDGAHTGPYGQRHGLRHLLDAAAAHDVPLVLLDLSTPQALSNLDLLGQTARLRQLANDGVLILPRAAQGDPQLAVAALQLSTQAAKTASLPTAPLIYAPLSQPLPAGVKAAFARLPDTSHIQQVDSARLIPLPQPSAEEQIGRGGLSLALRKSLLAAALSPDPTDLVVAGGSLPLSPWGDSSLADTAFAYLQAHPWIHPLNSADLGAVPAVPGELPAGCADLLCAPAWDASVLAAYPDLPAFQNALRASLMPEDQAPLNRLALLTYLNLTRPASAKDQIRQAGALDQVRLLLLARDWAAAPRSQAACSGPPGDEECVLSSESVWALIQTRTGGVPLAVVLQGKTPVLLLTSPAASGDSTLPPASFADSLGVVPIYLASAADGQITLSSLDGAIRKTFALLPHGLQVILHTERPLNWSAVLAPAALRRFEPGWAAALTPAGDLKPLELTADGASISFTSFSDSFNLLRQPEDPDAAFPPGHYLPTPLIAATFSPASDLMVSLTVP